MGSNPTFRMWRNQYIVAGVLCVTAGGNNAVCYCAESCYCTILEAMSNNPWIILYESKEHFEAVCTANGWT